MIGYKVVKVAEYGTYTSIVTDLERGGVVYHVGGVTYPVVEGSKLLAFRTLEAAQAAANWFRWSGYIFKAELEQPRPIKYLSSGYEWDCTADVRRVKAFWKLRHRHPRLSAAPKGTLACKSITLLEKVGKCGK